MSLTKIVAICFFIAVIVLAFGIVGHDSIAKAIRYGAMTKLQEPSNSTDIIGTYKNVYKKLGQYQVWINPSQSKADFTDPCEAIHKNLERTAANEDWASWDHWWQSAGQYNCTLVF